MILLDLSAADSRPIYGQIADRVKFAVAAGVLRPGELVPSVRELSKQLLVNPACFIVAKKGGAARDICSACRECCGAIIGNQQCRVDGHRRPPLAVVSPCRLWGEVSFFISTITLLRLNNFSLRKISVTWAFTVDSASFSSAAISRF